ncbi:MAG: acyl carrier protein [Candidatus Staskawiczbacteria bacterium]|jgi:acyl carrier protein
MDARAVEAIVIGIVSDELEVSADGITRETKLIGDLNADSLDLIDWVMQLEERFGITIPEEEAKRFETVGQVVNCVTKLLPQEATQEPSPA